MSCRMDKEKYRDDINTSRERKKEDYLRKCLGVKYGVQMRGCRMFHQCPVRPFVMRKKLDSMQGSGFMSIVEHKLKVYTWIGHPGGISAMVIP